MSRTSCALLASAIVIVLTTASTKASSQEFESHSAHVHGVTLVNIVIEKQLLSVSVESPAMNVLGFERAPRDASERAAVKRINTLLGKGDTLFIPSHDAACTLQSNKVVTPVWDAGDAEHDEHEHDDHDEKGSEHSEFKARYEFVCKQPKALTTIDIRLESILHADGKSIVNLINETRQTQHTLNKSSGTVRTVPLR